MGIRFYCPQGHKLNVKEFQAGRRGICPFCGEKIVIPTESSRPSSREERRARRAGVRATKAAAVAATGSQAAVSSQAIHQEAGGNGRSAHDATAVITSDSEYRLAGDETLAIHQPSGIPAPSIPLQDDGASDLPDALADAEDVVWYVRPPTGGQFGPATPDIVRTWLTEGRISSDTLVWREGWRDWLEAGSVFPQLALPYALGGITMPNPLEVAVVPRRATVTPVVGRNLPVGLIWIISGLGVLTLLMIAGVIWLLLR